jgi:hypothetical protein
MLQPQVSKDGNLVSQKLLAKVDITLYQPLKLQSIAKPNKNLVREILRNGFKR